MGGGKQAMLGREVCVETVGLPGYGHSPLMFIVTSEGSHSPHIASPVLYSPHHGTSQIFGAHYTFKPGSQYNVNVTLRQEVIQFSMGLVAGIEMMSIPTTVAATNPLKIV